MAAKKTISLNISERMAALSVLNGYKGKLEHLRVILDDIGGFSITNEEWEKAERKITSLGETDARWNWNDEKGGEKEIEVDAEITAKYLRDTIDEKDKNGEFTIQDKAYITLKEKLL